MSAGYNFFKNCWIMKQVTKELLQEKIKENRITEEEYNKIISTEQIKLQ